MPNGLLVRSVTFCTPRRRRLWDLSVARLGAVAGRWLVGVPVDACWYDLDSTTVDDACPSNSLYRDFLADHEDALRTNHRVGLVYSHLDVARNAGDLAAIRKHADEARSFGKPRGL